MACPSGTGTFFNTDLARARGVNFTGQVMPARWLRIIGNYTHDDSRVVTSPNAFDPALLPGNHLLRRPVDLVPCRFWRPGKTSQEVLRIFQRRAYGQRLSVSGAPATNAGLRAVRSFHELYLWSRRKYVCAGAESFRQAISGCAGVPGARREVRVGMNYRFGGKR